MAPKKQISGGAPKNAKGANVLTNAKGADVLKNANDGGMMNLGDDFLNESSSSVPTQAIPSTSSVANQPSSSSTENPPTSITEQNNADVVINPKRAARLSFLDTLGSDPFHALTPGKTTYV
jgi:hypothetical protein